MPGIESLGSAVASPGTIQYGRWEAYNHPTGVVEFLPVILAQGKKPGPCLWLTAGIHGPEQAGPLVLYQLITQDLVDNLCGTIVALPALNPVGLRSKQRQPYHTAKDPNRLWPDGKPKNSPDPDRDPPCSLETAYERLFASLIASADMMIDYHNAWIGSISFAFADRVFYRADKDVEKNRVEAEALALRQHQILAAYGHTVIHEMPSDRLLDDDLHRSTSGAALLLGRIPAFTVELGTGEVPDPSIVAASVAGTRNVMRQMGMLPGELEPITGIKIVNPGFPVRRCATPRATEACVVIHQVEPGDLVRQGDAVAEVRDAWGRPLGAGFLYSDYDGFVIGREHGIYYYAGEPVMTLAIRNDAPPVAPYPPDYFKVPESVTSL